MDFEAETTLPDDISEILFRQVMAEIQGVAKWIDGGFSVYRDVLGGEQGASGQPGPVPHCRVFWGSHGCRHPRGHSPEIPHECDCCECPGETCKPSCVAKPPWYGPETRFYGEEAEALGLPLVDSSRAPGSNGRLLG